MMRYNESNSGSLSREEFMQLATMIEREYELSDNNFSSAEGVGPYRFIRTLGKGAEGAKELAKYVENKRVKDNLSLRAHMLRALGKTQDDKQIDYLIEVTSRSPHDELRAAAGEALGLTVEGVPTAMSICASSAASWAGGSKPRDSTPSIA